MTIEVKNLYKSYGDKKVFENLNLSIELHGITALMSPSGSGKTTLLRILAGLEKYDGGSVSIVSPVSFMFQEDRLLPWLTVKENVSIVSDNQIAERILKRLSLENEMNEYPKNLSGGMKRRVALARALSYKSDVLFLDEALKGLDDELKKKTELLLIEESKERPIIIVTHDKAEANDLNANIIELN